MTHLVPGAWHLVCITGPSGEEAAAAGGERGVGRLHRGRHGGHQNRRRAQAHVRGERGKSSLLPASEELHSTGTQVWPRGWGGVGWGGVGVLVIVYGRSLSLHDPRIPTIPPSAKRREVFRAKAELHPVKNPCKADFGTLRVVSCVGRVP